MSITEQTYRAWCDKMAAKAALEQYTPPPLGAVLSKNPSSSESDAEPFHSTRSKQDAKFSTPRAIRRRSMSDPQAGVSGNFLQQARTGTWPRSACASISRPRQRPTVPRRQSSHFSTLSRQRSDLRTLHRESCQLFSSIDATVTDSGYSSMHRQGSSRFASTASFQQPATPAETSPRCSTSFVRPPLSTVVSWKSEATRRMEYAKIDEAHSGLRGLCKKILPKYVGKRSWRKFFDGKCDGDSVRRMRMPFSDEDEEVDGE